MSFFKCNIRLVRTSFSENTSIKLHLFFTEDGRAYKRTMMTGCLRQKHKVTLAEKRVDTALSTVFSQFTAQRRTSTTRAVNLIPYRADYFAHKLHIEQNENQKVCCLRFMLKL